MRFSKHNSEVHVVEGTVTSRLQYSYFTKDPIYHILLNNYMKIT